MKKLEESIKYFNLVFTDTLVSNDFSKVGFDLDKKKVNYDNCISLYDLISKFNKLYSLFKKEYRDLDKLDLGKNVEVLDFSKFDLFGDNIRFLSMYINKPTITNHQNTYLYLREFNNDICPYVTNNINMFDKDYYNNLVDLDKEKVKKYLDLFEKYSLLLDLYDRLFDQMIFGDGTFSIFSKIKSENDSILNDLENIAISIHNNPHMSIGDHFQICVNLGDKLSIDSNNSTIRLGEHILKSDKKLYLKVLKSIYLHGRYLNNYCNRSKDNEKTKLKSLMNIDNHY